MAFSDQTMVDRFQDPVSVLYQQGLNLYELEEKNSPSDHPESILKQLANGFDAHRRSANRAAHHVGFALETSRANSPPLQPQSSPFSQPPLPVRHHSRSGISFTRTPGPRTSVIIGPNGRRKAIRGSHARHLSNDSRASRRSRESSASSNYSHNLPRAFMNKSPCTHSPGEGWTLSSLTALVEQQHQKNLHPHTPYKSATPRFSDLLLSPPSPPPQDYDHNSFNSPLDISPRQQKEIDIALQAPHETADHPNPKPSLTPPEYQSSCTTVAADAGDSDNNSASSGRPRHSKKKILNKELPPLPPVDSDMLQRPAGENQHPQHHNNNSNSAISFSGSGSNSRSSSGSTSSSAAGCSERDHRPLGSGESQSPHRQIQGRKQPPPPIIISSKPAFRQMVAVGPGGSANNSGSADGSSTASSGSASPVFLSPASHEPNPSTFQNLDAEDPLNRTHLNFTAPADQTQYAGPSTILLVAPSPTDNSDTEPFKRLSNMYEQSFSDAPFSPAKRDSTKTENTYTTNESTESLKQTISTRSSVISGDSIDVSEPVLSQPKPSGDEPGSLYVNSLRRCVNVHEQPDYIASDQIAGPEAQPRIRKKFNLIRELVETEEIFATDMAVVLDIYARRLSGERFFGFVGREDMLSLFSNTEQILLLSRQFCSILRQIVNPYVFEAKENKDQMLADVETRVGSAIKDYIPALEAAFQIYCNHNKAQMETFVKIKVLACPTIDRWLWECFEDSKALTSAWTLDSLLIKPVQRLLKYPLLVKGLLETTPDNHPDHQNLRDAVQGLQACADRINDSSYNTGNFEEATLFLSGMRTPEPQSAKSASFSKGAKSNNSSAGQSKHTSVHSNGSRRLNETPEEEYLRLTVEPNADGNLLANIEQFHARKRQLLDLSNAFRNNAYTIQGHFDCNNRLAKSWLNWVSNPEDVKLDATADSQIPSMPSMPSRSTLRSDAESVSASSAKTVTEPSKALESGQNIDRRYKSFASFSTPFLSNSPHHSSLSSAKLAYKMDRDVLTPLDKVWHMYERTEALISERIRYHSAYAKYISTKNQADGGSANVYYTPRDPSRPSQQLSTVEKQKADLFMKYHNSLNDGLPDLFHLTEEIVELAMAKYVTIQRRWFRLAVDSMATVFQVRVDDIKDVHGNKDRDPILEKFRKRQGTENKSKDVVENLAIVQKQGAAAKAKRLASRKLHDDNTGDDETHRYDDEDTDVCSKKLSNCTLMPTVSPRALESSPPNEERYADTNSCSSPSSTPVLGPTKSMPSSPATAIQIPKTESVPTLSERAGAVTHSNSKENLHRKPSMLTVGWGLRNRRSEKH